ncbi:rCG25502 [Rattus norvegicus]|uniref:RCG25502 n=1 Tax=Rattus norvegicus TaxID=10116 RepID=A6I3T2_RAT|nr:rCG25502 [Rattus norvegicus]
MDSNVTTSETTKLQATGSSSAQNPLQRGGERSELGGGLLFGYKADGPRPQVSWKLLKHSEGGDITHRMETKKHLQ